MIPKPIEVCCLEKYKIKLTYSDGTTGVADLGNLAGKGVFSLWNENGTFENVYINEETDAIAWNEDIDLCPDTLYLQLRNMSFEQWKETQLVYAYH